MIYRAPSFSQLLLDGAPWTFTVDHGALLELCARQIMTDPIAVLTKMEKQNWSWDCIWELAWSATWKQRQTSPTLTFCEFVSKLPIGPDWPDFRKRLIASYYDALAVKSDEEAAPVNPPVPPVPDGTGGADSM